MWRACSRKPNDGKRQYYAWDKNKIRHDTTRQGTTRHTTRQDTRQDKTTVTTFTTTRHDTTQQGTRRHDTTRQDTRQAKTTMTTFTTTRQLQDKTEKDKDKDNTSKKHKTQLPPYPSMFDGILASGLKTSKLGVGFRQWAETHNR